MRYDTTSTLSALESFDQASEALVVQFQSFWLGHAFVVRVKRRHWPLVLPCERPKQHPIIILTIFFRVCSNLSSVSHKHRRILELFYFRQSLIRFYQTAEPIVIFSAECSVAHSM